MMIYEMIKESTKKNEEHVQLRGKVIETMRSLQEFGKKMESRSQVNAIDTAKQLEEWLVIDATH